MVFLFPFVLINGDFLLWDWTPSTNLLPRYIEPFGVDTPQHILTPFLLYSRSEMEQKMLYLGSLPQKKTLKYYQFVLYVVCNG